MDKYRVGGTTMKQHDKQKRRWKSLTIFSAVLAAALCIPIQGGVSAAGKTPEMYVDLTTEDKSVLIGKGGQDCGDPCQGHRISGKATQASFEGIWVKGGNHKIIFEGVDIDQSKKISEGRCVFNIENGASVELILGTGNSTLAGGNNMAGIYVSPDSKLTISREEGKNTILKVTGGDGAAGIGGQGGSGVPGQITVKSGEINATGGQGAAGIGGGTGYGAGKITIDGGKVTATGGKGNKNAVGGNGIGGGSGVVGDSGEIILNGGEITATAGANGSGVDQEIKAEGIRGKTLTSDLGSHAVVTATLDSNTNTSGFNGLVLNSNTKTYSVYGDVNIQEAGNALNNNNKISLMVNSALTVPDKWQWSGEISGQGSLVYNESIAATNIVGHVTNKKLLTAADILSESKVYTGKNIKLWEYKSAAVLGRELDTANWTQKILKDGKEVREAVDAGTYKVEFKKEGYKAFDITATINPRDIAVKDSDNEVQHTISGDMSYRGGDEVKPDIELTLTSDGNKIVLGEGTDYEVTYENNTAVTTEASPAKAVLTGKGNCTGTRTIEFQIVPADISKATVTAEFQGSDTYDGKAKTPDVTVEMDGKTLTETTDYVVTYNPDNLTDAGKIAVKVTGTGTNYQGENNTASLEIQPIELTVVGADAKNRQYDSTDQVEITNVELKTDDILADDQDGVEADLTGLTGTIKAPDVGEYEEVTFEKMSLKGGRAHNYRVKLPAEDIRLGTPIEISKADGPAAPELTASYDISKKDDSKFICTITVKNPIADAEYRYSMDGEKEGKKNEFDKIVPEEEHTFEVWTAETDNVKEGKHGKITVLFEKLPQDPPQAFTLEFEAEKDGTFTAVIPESENENVQYGFGNTVDEVKWSGDNKLKDCKPDTAYTGWMKFMDDATHRESEAVSNTQTTPKLEVERPVISPESGKFLTTQTITITCETEGAEIYYTLDGKDPTTDSIKYTEPFTIDSSVTVRAIAVKEGMENSAVAAATYVKAGDKDILSKLDIVEGIPEVAPGLAGTDANTIEAIQTKMTRILTSIEGYTYLNTAFYDISIQISVDGVNWEKATVDNFPSNGVTITLPYPPGTGKNTHDFVVSHMFTESSNRLGITAGETEEPAVTKTAEGLSFTVKGTSPVAVAWKQAAQGNTDGSNTGNGSDNGDGTNTGDGTNNGDGTNTGDGTNNGDGTNKGTVAAAGNGTGSNGTGTNTGNGTNTTGNGTDNTNKGLSSLLPKTGDTASLLLWGIPIAVSVIVIVLVVIMKKRKK